MSTKSKLTPSECKALDQLEWILNDVPNEFKLIPANKSDLRTLCRALRRLSSNAPSKAVKS